MPKRTTARRANDGTTENNRWLFCSVYTGRTGKYITVYSGTVRIVITSATAQRAYRKDVIRRILLEIRSMRAPHKNRKRTSLSLFEDLVGNDPPVVANYSNFLSSIDVSSALYKLFSFGTWLRHNETWSCF